MRTLQTFLLSVLLISVHSYPQDALLSEKDIAAYGLSSDIQLEEIGAIRGDVTSKAEELKPTNPPISEVETPVGTTEGTETLAVTVSTLSSIDLDIETQQVAESDVTWATSVTNDSDARNLKPEIPAEEAITEISLEEKVTEVANDVASPADTEHVSSELPKEDNDGSVQTVATTSSIEGLRNVIIETLFKTTMSSEGMELTTETNCNTSSTPDMSLKSPESSTANDLSPVSTSNDTEPVSEPETDRPITSDLPNVFNARRIELSLVESTNEVSIPSDLNEGPESTTAALSDNSSPSTQDLVPESSLQNTATAVVEDNSGIPEETSTLKTEQSTEGAEDVILQNSTLSPQTSPEVQTTANLPRTRTALLEDEIEQSTGAIETPQPAVILQNTTATPEVKATSTKCACGCGADVISTNSDAGTTPEAEKVDVETSTQSEKDQATEDLLGIESRIEPEIVIPLEEASIPTSSTTNEVLEIEESSPGTQIPVDVSEPTSSSTAVSVTTPEPCTVAGNFSSIINCRSYISCSGNATNLLQQELECPERHAFSPILKRCTRDIAPCSGDLTPECLAAGGTPDPNSPSAYYWCIPSLLGGFHKYHIQCATNEQFTSIIGRCLPTNPTAESNKTTSEDLPSDRDIAKADWKQLKKEIKRKAKEEKIRRKMEAKAKAEAEKLSAKQKKPIKKIEDDDDEEDDD